MARSSSTAALSRPLTSGLLTLIERELGAVRREVDAYARDDQLWQGAVRTSELSSACPLDPARSV